MEEEARAVLVREFGPSDMVFERHAGMRYTGQRHNIKVAISNTGTPADIRLAFDRDYRRRYGHADAKAKAEIQALHLSAVTRLRRPELRHLPRRDEPASSPGVRSVYFGGHGMMESAIYQRVSLPPGFAAAGPAIIEEYGSTTLVWPGDRFTIGDLHEIQVHCGKTSGDS
jgi:N-methylhydantoinase A